jgi:hypothetical protein
LLLVLSGILGAQIGAMLVLRVSKTRLRQFLVLLLVFASIYMLIRRLGFPWNGSIKALAIQGLGKRAEIVKA